MPYDSQPRHEIHHYIQMVFDRAWLLALCVVISGLAAAVYLHRAPRIYRANAVVQIESAPHTIIEIEEVMADELATEASVQTMVQKLRCRPVLAWVIETNHLDKNPAFVNPSEFPPPDKEALVTRLEGMVSTSLRRMTRLADITVSSTDPKLAAQIANSIINEFTDQDSITRSAHTRSASSFLQEEAARLKAKLEKSEDALQKYSEQAGSVSVQHGQQFYLPRLQAANVRHGQAEADAVKLATSLAQIRALTNQIEALLSLPQVASDPALTQSRQRFASAQGEFADVQLRYKSKHPKYQQAAARVEDARQVLVRDALQLPESYRLALASALTDVTNTALAVKEAEVEALRLSEEAIRFNMLSREVESDRALFASVLKRLAETSLTTDIRSEKVRVIQPAIPPRMPSSPKVGLVLAAAALAGLMAGLGIVFALNALDRSIQTVEQAEHHLGLPVLNVVPRIKNLHQLGQLLLGSKDARSVGAEAFRALRTALSMLGKAEERRTFLFTSATPDEGKTFVSANFAAALAQQGLKTLLVDADLRRPSLQEFFTGNSEVRLPGLTNYLTGQKGLDEILQTVPSHPNLAWVPAGTSAPNPSELLAQDGLRKLLADGLKHFDRIVVDTAPIMAVSDTLSIAVNVQTTVLVVRSHRTPLSAATRTVQRLRQAGAKLSGLVINQEPRHWGPGSYGDGSRYYSGYYEDGQSGDKAHKKPRSQPRLKIVR